MDVLEYTRDELEKQFNLLELHGKQAPTMGADFCRECVRKHLASIEGLAEEGVLFTMNPEEKEMFLKFAGQARDMRKELTGAGANPVGEIRETERFRHETLRSEGECEPGSFRTIIRKGHRIVICCPKGQYDPKARMCKVGTMAQKILHPIWEDEGAECGKVCE